LLGDRFRGRAAIAARRTPHGRNIVNLQEIVPLILGLMILGFLGLKVFRDREMAFQEGLPIAIAALMWVYLQIRIVAYGERLVHAAAGTAVITLLLMGQYYWRHPPHRENAAGRKLKKIAREKGIK
jgi:hypothetical protein